MKDSKGDEQEIHRCGLVGGLEAKIWSWWITSELCTQQRKACYWFGFPLLLLEVVKYSFDQTLRGKFSWQRRTNTLEFCAIQENSVFQAHCDNLYVFFFFLKRAE